MFRIKTIEPPTLLKKHVKCSWYRGSDASTGKHSTYKLLADGAPGLIFHHNEGNATLNGKHGSNYRLPSFTARPAMTLHGSKEEYDSFKAGNERHFASAIITYPWALWCGF